MTKLEMAIIERDQYLADNPHLRSFQDDLDKCLKYKTQHERNITLNNMIVHYLRDLAAELGVLKSVLNRRYK